MADVFCFSCGEVIKQEAEICPKCGVRQINKSVNNILIWILAFIPLIGALFEFGTLVFLAINIILCFIDDKILEKSGYDTDSLDAWLVPVYLYKRAKMLGHNLAYFIVWCVSFGLSFFGFFE
jgi:hypothetical protein